MKSPKTRRVITKDVPIATFKEAAGKQGIDRGALCSLLIHGDHSYIAARFLIWADSSHMWELGTFLAAHAVEMYLKAFIVSRVDKLPRKLTSGTKGHDLVHLLDSASHFSDGDFFDDPSLKQILEELSPMSQAGRYPRSGYRGPAGEIGAFVDWLDSFAFHIRTLVPFPENCRDDIELLEKFDASSTPILYEKIGRGAMRDIFFAQNRAFLGWFPTQDGRRVKLDGSSWE